MLRNLEGFFQLWAAHALLAGLVAALIARLFGLRILAVIIGFGLAALAGWGLSVLWPDAAQYWKKLPAPRDVFLKDSSILDLALGWIPSLVTGAGGVFFFRRRGEIPPWAERAERVTRSRGGWILLGVAFLFYLSFHAPLVEQTDYHCQTCDTRRHERKKVISKETRETKTRFTAWVERRGGPHAHAWEVESLESFTVWGKNLRAETAVAKKAAAPDWGAIFERLERLELDRPFYAAFVDLETRGRAIGAARRFNSGWDDAQVRQWWKETQERLGAPRGPGR